MVNIDFETTTGAVCYHAQDIESVLRRSRNGSSSIRNVVFLTCSTAHANPLREAFNIGLSLPVGIDEYQVALNAFGQAQVFNSFSLPLFIVKHT